MTKTIKPEQFGKDIRKFLTDKVKFDGVLTDLLGHKPFIVTSDAYTEKTVRWKFFLTCHRYSLDIVPYEKNDDSGTLTARDSTGVIVLDVTQERSKFIWEPFNGVSEISKLIRKG